MEWGSFYHHCVANDYTLFMNEGNIIVAFPYTLWAKNRSLVLLRCLLKTQLLPPGMVLHSSESSLQWQALCRQRYSLCSENNPICYLQKSGGLGACVLTSVFTRAWFIDPINFCRDQFNGKPNWLLQLGQAAWYSTLPSLLGHRPL